MPPEKKIFIFFGMIASGKSTLASAWAERHGLRYYNSDVLRKELAGIDAHRKAGSALDQGIYTREFSRRTYDALLEHAEDDLNEGLIPVLDASYQQEKERSLVRELAQKCHAEVYFIFCSCSDEEVKRRLAVRAEDPEAVSDANLEIYESQKRRFEQPSELPGTMLIHFDTEGPLESLLARLDKAVAQLPPE